MRTSFALDKRLLPAGLPEGGPAFILCSALWGPSLAKGLGGLLQAPVKSALTRSWAWPLQGRDGSHCHAGLPAAFPIAPSDPVCPLLSTSGGSPLAQNKSNPLILHDSQYPPLELHFPNAHPLPLHPSFPSLPAAPQICQAHSHPRAFALVDPSPGRLFPREPHTLLPHLTQASAPSPCQRPSLPRYSRGLCRCPYLASFVFVVVTVLITT